MATAIFEIWESLEEDRPRSPYLLQSIGPHADWDNLSIIQAEPDSAGKVWTPLDLSCREQGTTPPSAWDYFHEAHYDSLLSARAIDVLTPCLNGWLEPLPSTLDGQPYFFLRTVKPIDCLDVERSSIEYFTPEEGGGILQIDRHAFRKERVPDPAIFRIPERPLALFATASVPQIIQDAGLTGFRFPMVDGPPKVATGHFTYRNEYFRFTMKIPDVWSLTTWRNQNLPPATPEVPCQFQTADDQLPARNGRRYLFLAHLFRPLDDIAEDAGIELSLWQEDDDFGVTLLKNLTTQRGGGICGQGKWPLAPYEFEYADTDLGAGGRRRFAYSNVGPGLWFYAVVMGVTPEYFESAVEVFETMRPLK